MKRAVRSFQDRADRRWTAREFGLRFTESNDPVRDDIRARELLLRAERVHDWVPQPLYPTGGAAGPLLLYLLIRILAEQPVRRVVEFGAGETSKIVDAWSSRFDGVAVTVDDDAWWAARLAAAASSPSHAVLHLPLVPHNSKFGRTQWYDLSQAGAATDEPFDLVVVDGPIGVSALSRVGIVDHFARLVGEEWVVLWDDLDRPADLRSFARMVSTLRERGVEHDHRLVEGDRTIGLIFTPGFRAVAYYG